jgi:transposase
MPSKRYTIEEINSKLQQIKLFLLTGDRLPEACKRAGVSAPSYYRWKKQVDSAKKSSPNVISSKRSASNDIDDSNDLYLLRNSMFSYR